MATYDISLYATRIADKDRVDQSGSDDGDVVGWNKANEFILCTAFRQLAGKAARAFTLFLQWRDVTDEGTFVAIQSTGEISYTTTDTVLSDGTAVISSERRCGTGGDLWQDGRENENDNIEPDSGIFTLVVDYETEFQWGLDCSGAEDGHEYEFRVWDFNNDREVGVCLATLTIYQEPPPGWSKILNKVTGIKSVNGIPVEHIKSINGV